MGKRCIAILLSLFFLSACAPKAEQEASLATTLESTVSPTPEATSQAIPLEGILALAHSTEDEIAPNWSSDSQSVYWTRYHQLSYGDYQTEFYQSQLSLRDSPELILTIDGYVLQPHWSPNGEYLTFLDEIGMLQILDRQGNRILYLSGVPSSHALTWSADNTSLLLSIGHRSLIHYLDGREEELPLSLETVNYGDYGDGFSWSDDGENIVFTNMGDIFHYSQPEQSLVNLTESEALDSVPAISPDGTQLAYLSASVAYDYSDSPFRTGNYGLYIMNVDGSGQRRLSSSHFDDFCPTWSPDGKKLAFLRGDVVGRYGAILMIYDTQTEQFSWLERPFGQTAGCPTWSPDGEWLAFEAGLPESDIYIAPITAFKSDISETAISYQVAFVPENLALGVYDNTNTIRSQIGSLGNGVFLDFNGEVWNEEWLGIRYEAQDAWIQRNYVIGNLEPILFCEDTRVGDLISSLQEALRSHNNEAFARLIAPQGLFMALPQGNTIHLQAYETRRFFEDYAKRYWGVNWGDEPIIQSIADDIVPLIERDLLAENIRIACQNNQYGLSEQSVFYSISLPNHYELLNFYSVMRPGAAGNEMDWGAWGIGISYWQGEPKILALGHYTWTP